MPGKHESGEKDAESARPAWQFSGRRGTPVDLAQSPPASLPEKLQRDVGRIARERQKHAAKRAIDGSGSKSVSGNLPVAAAPQPIERRAPRASGNPVNSSASAILGPSAETLNALIVTDLIPPELTSGVSLAPGQAPAPRVAASASPTPISHERTIELAPVGATMHNDDTTANEDFGDVTPGAGEGAAAPERSRKPRRELSPSERKRLAKAKMKRRKELEKQKAKDAKKGVKPAAATKSKPQRDVPSTPTPTAAPAFDAPVNSAAPAFERPETPSFGAAGATTPEEAPATNQTATTDGGGSKLKRLFQRGGSGKSAHDEQHDEAELAFPELQHTADDMQFAEAPAPEAWTGPETTHHDEAPWPIDASPVETTSTNAAAWTGDELPPVGSVEAFTLDIGQVDETPVANFDLMAAIEPSPIEAAHTAVDMIGDPALLLPIAASQSMYVEPAATPAASAATETPAPASPAPVIDLFDRGMQTLASTSHKTTQPTLAAAPAASPAPAADTTPDLAPTPEPWLTAVPTPAPVADVVTPIVVHTPEPVTFTPEPVTFTPEPVGVITPESAATVTFETTAPEPIAQDTPTFTSEPVAEFVQVVSEPEVPETAPRALETREHREIESTRQRIRRSRPKQVGQTSDLRIQEREIRARIEAKRRELDALFSSGPTGE